MCNVPIYYFSNSKQIICRNRKYTITNKFLTEFVKKKIKFKMSYGPQLPAHLQKKQQESESDEDQSYGPKLPTVACKGPKMQNSESESEEDSYGPKLPSVPCRGPEPSSIGPQIPSGVVTIGPQRPLASSSIGPQIPQSSTAK